MDKASIANIRLMVERGLKFFREYGLVTKNGFNFLGGYTEQVDKGSGDFLTKDTLWDFKVSKTEPNKEYTLQSLIYYLMGQQSIHPEFKTIKWLEIYNPRQNKVYTLEISSIARDVLEIVSKDIIGYSR